MDSLEAVETILGQAAEPLHYQDITAKILEKDLWQTEGKTPDATINARLAVDIKKYASLSRFMRTEPGVFALREWGLQEHFIQKKSKVSETPAKKEKLTFLDAAELILDSADEKRPLNYRDITDRNIANYLCLDI